MYLLAVLVLLTEPIRGQLIRDRRPSIRLPQGYVTGTKVYGDGGKIADAYLGIPYAAPPVRNLRFAPPQPPNWNGTLQATDYGPQCPQLPISQNDGEDCLYLNVWAPESALRYGAIPVVIVLEGFEFSRTNRIPIPGQDLALEGVVVVTINYRMNIFGFLCTGTQDMRGNFGLIDQYVAMLWVKENIKYFGGDPDKITLFGYSSGAASVVYHMISPRTAGLFHRAIISSGSITSPWHLPNEQYTASQKIINMLGCSYAPTMLQCLREKSTRDILMAYEEYLQSDKLPDVILPVVDTFLPETDRYLPTEPLTSLKTGTYIQVPILTGISHPSSDPQYRFWADLSRQGAINLQQFVEHSKIPEIMRRYQFDVRNQEEIAELLRWRYVSTSGDVRIMLDDLKDLEFQSKIEAPHFAQLNYLASTFVQPIYAYDLGDIGLNVSSDSTMSCDILLLFGPLLLNQIGRRRFSTNEMRYSRKLKQLFTNFIIFGNPTPNNNVKQWRRYAANEYYVENFDVPPNNNNDQVKNYKDITFWNQLLPKLANVIYDGNGDPRGLHTSPDPAAGFRHAMYTLVGLVIALLALLLICIILLKRRNKENERHLHMGY